LAVSAVYSINSFECFTMDSIAASAAKIAEGTSTAVEATIPVPLRKYLLSMI
jgi:hypothetical protein